MITTSFLLLLPMIISPQHSRRFLQANATHPMSCYWNSHAIWNTICGRISPWPTPLLSMWCRLFWYVIFVNRYTAVIRVAHWNISYALDHLSCISFELHIETFHMHLIISPAFSQWCVRRWLMRSSAKMSMPGIPYAQSHRMEAPLAALPNPRDRHLPRFSVVFWIRLCRQTIPRETAIPFRFWSGKALCFSSSTVSK